MRNEKFSVACHFFAIYPTFANRSSQNWAEYPSFLEIPRLRHNFAVRNISEDAKVPCIHIIASNFFGGVSNKN